MSMPRPTRLRSIMRPLISFFAAALAIGPASAEETSPADGLEAEATIAAANGFDDAPRYLQDSDIDENILLPAARPDDDDPERTWSRDYFAVAAGVLSPPEYNGAADRRLDDLKVARIVSGELVFSDLYQVLADFTMNLAVEVTIDPRWRQLGARVPKAVEIAARNVEKGGKERIAAWPAVHVA